jgi:hypothetical protein
VRDLLNRYVVALTIAAGMWLGLIALAVRAQEAEVVPYTPLAVARAAGATGLKVNFKLDGGCDCRVESRVPNDPTPCNGVLCTAARLRAVVNIADAIDGGALDR